MSDDNEPIRINFTGVEGRKGFALLPSGRYIAEITDFSEDEAGDEAKNPGAKMVNWEFTLESDLEGNDTTEATIRNEDRSREKVEVKIDGRRVWDNMVLVEAMLPRVKEFLDAQWYDTSGEIDLYPEQMLNNRLILQVGTQRAKKDRKTGKEYNARNKVDSFHRLESERPQEEEAPAPVTAEKGKKSTKAPAEGTVEAEEAKV